MAGFGPRTGPAPELDFAAVLLDLVDMHFPQAEKVVLVCDNLNTHHPRVPYEAFPAAELRAEIEAWVRERHALGTILSI